MKTTKIPTNTAKNASKLHKHVGELLVELFPNFDVRQEVCVSRINPSFESNREKFDWVVLRMNIVIEVHGEQHYAPVCFGGITIDQAKRNFVKRQEVDYEKEIAAKEAGWAYVVVKYDEKKITASELSERITSAMEQVESISDIQSTKPKAKIQSRGFVKGPKQKIQSRGFQKPEGGYKWPKRKIKS